MKGNENMKSKKNPGSKKKTDKGKKKKGSQGKDGKNPRGSKQGTEEETEREKSTPVGGRSVTGTLC